MVPETIEYLADSDAMGPPKEMVVIDLEDGPDLGKAHGQGILFDEAGQVVYEGPSKDGKQEGPVKQ